MSPLIVGVAGGSGSGKTTIARRIVDELGPETAAVLTQDGYYHDHSELSLEQRAGVNYDHPDAFDMELLVGHVEALKAGKAVDAPLYNFATHRRMRETLRIEPVPVIVLEGILVLAQERLRNLMDIRIFVDAEPDIRFIRRLQRDVQERGRGLNGVVSQYLETVRTMHLIYCEPSKREADVIFPRGGHNEVAIRMLIDRIRAILGDGAPASRSPERTYPNG